jgi:nucleotide-binding universal stress UspA family protein
VAVDLNEPYGFETPYAYSIVQPGGTVRLVHNIESFRLPVPGTGGSPGELSRKEEHAQQIAACEERLRALAPSSAEARGIVTEVEVTSGQETALSICSAAERFNADIVCLGVHTRHGFTDKKLGSVPLAVLQSCRRPTLVVWPPAE